VNLLDTATLLWAATSPGLLSPRARDLLSRAGSVLVVSPVTTYELAQKAAFGKIDLAVPAPGFVEAAADLLGAVFLPVEQRHMAVLAGLPWRHRDPFDRILAAQAIAEGLAIISPDAAFDALGAPRAW
jgi:PIN domain nuclease of toxin-antitoxin system